MESFINEKGHTMSEYEFRVLCVQGKYSANKVKSLAWGEGYNYVESFCIDLQSNIDVNFPEQHLLRTRK